MFSRAYNYETYAKWFKEVGLLCLAALVVQNIIEGTHPLAPSVIFGVMVAGVAYYQAYRLIEKT
jgi:hypothetical protein